MNRRRSSDVIISQILEVCIEGATKTKIVYQSNLNFTTVNPYLDLLIKQGLIEVQQGQRIIYRTTDRGIEIMRSFKELQGEIDKICTDLENALT